MNLFCYLWWQCSVLNYLVEWRYCTQVCLNEEPRLKSCCWWIMDVFPYLMVNSKYKGCLSETFKINQCWKIFYGVCNQPYVLNQLACILPKQISYDQLLYFCYLIAFYIRYCPFIFKTCMLWYITDISRLERVPPPAPLKSKPSLVLVCGHARILQSKDPTFD